MNISEVRSIVQKDGIVFLSYGGFLTQALISAMTEALEKEAQEHNISMSISNNIFTIFIELSQNMMNYSKTLDKETIQTNPEGLIMVSKDIDGNYYIDSQNVVDLDDKNKIEPKLKEVQSLDRDGIKKRYRELRRSGKNTHGKGGGIGIYEIAKRCEKIDYDFKQINDNKYYYHIKTKILTNKD